MPVVFDGGILPQNVLITARNGEGIVATIELSPEEHIGRFHGAFQSEAERLKRCPARFRSRIGQTPSNERSARRKTRSMWIDVVLRMIVSLLASSTVRGHR